MYLFRGILPLIGITREEQIHNAVASANISLDETFPLGRKFLTFPKKMIIWTSFSIQSTDYLDKPLPQRSFE